MRRRAVVASVVAAGLIASAGAGSYFRNHEASVVASASAATNPAPASAVSVALPDFSSMVAANGPAVVNVTVTQIEKTKAQGPNPQFRGFDKNDPFFQFFRQFQIPMPREYQAPVQGQGSGFIVRPDGVILTNAHVVDGASVVTVKLTDKREFKAKVLGIDKPTDIAVLKIDASDLPTVRLGDSSALKVGQWVLAIGSPYGFDNSVTAGIVSAKFRSLPDGSVPFIQTDVPVNPGNSGGPLFNMKGEVVGINSQIYTTSGGYQGLSFAIPINIAQKVETELVAHGHVDHARMGVAIQEVNQDLAKSFGLDKAEGALISSVNKGSAAAKAGLEAGDIILKVDGKPVASSSELPPLIAGMTPGTKIQVEILRQGKRKEVQLTLDKLQSTQVASSDGQDKQHGRLGLAVRPLTPEEKQSLEVPSGLLVEESSGPAASAGIQPGDVIVAVNGTPVKSVEQLRSLAAKAGKNVALLVRRNDATIFVPVELG